MTRTAFEHLFSPEEAEDLENRTVLLEGIQAWLKAHAHLSQEEAAAQLGVTQAHVSELKNGKISRFSIDKLMAIASRAGLRPKVLIQAQAQLPA